MNILLLLLLSLPSVLGIKVPLSTKGANVVDNTGVPIKLHCTSWSGFHMEDYLAFGLEYQTVDNIIKLINEGGFNCVKMQFSTEIVYYDPVVNSKLLVDHNNNLIGMTGIEIFTYIINKLTKSGLMVILDYHILDAKWCCDPFDENGLWYNDRWSENTVILQLLKVVRLLKNNSLVVGVDIRNEIRPSLKLLNITVSGKRIIDFSKSEYPNWGKGGKNDWASAAERFGDAVHSVNDKLLIIVQGIFVLGLQEIIIYLNGNTPKFPQSLRGVIYRPINLKVPNKVVYSAHSYSWNYNINWNSEDSWEHFNKQSDYNWGFIKKDLNLPLFIGEFGTGHNVSELYFQYITRYIKENNLDWAYWSLEGNQNRKKPADINWFGLLDVNYTTFAYKPMLRSLQDLMKLN